jgi:hypothetical protein
VKYPLLAVCSLSLSLMLMLLSQAIELGQWTAALDLAFIVVIHVLALFELCSSKGLWR